MYRYYLALKFMISRPINLLGILGVMLGVWALISVVSIFDGYGEELTKQFTMASSDLSIFRLGPRAQFGQIREIVEADPNVVACSPRLVWRGLVHPRDDSDLRTWLPGAIQKDGRFTSVTGIEPLAEQRTTGLDGWIAAADEDYRVGLDALEPGGDWILISQRKATGQENPIVKGEKLTITTARVHEDGNAPRTQFLNADFQVAGAFRTRHAGFDNLTVLVSIDRLRSMIAGDNENFVNEIAVKLRETDATSTAETRQRLADALRTLSYYRLSAPVVTIAGEIERGFMQAIVHQAGLMKMVLFVIMVVAGFLVYATLSMMVTEKTHDIGVITALGGTKAGVLQVFLTTGFAISLLGTILGIASGCLTAIYLDDFNQLLKATLGIDLFPAEVYNLPGVPYSLDVIWITLVGSVSLALGLLVSLLPAYRALRNDPLACLRNE